MPFMGAMVETNPLNALEFQQPFRHIN